MTVSVVQYTNQVLKVSYSYTGPFHKTVYSYGTVAFSCFYTKMSKCIVNNRNYKSQKLSITQNNEVI